VASKKDIKKMSIEDLNKYLIELNESLFNFRFQKSLQQLEHPQKLRHVKRDIARVKTLIKEIELGVR
tara:strand:+ start:2349 stop:2549 length:201 start_codon:yes stop_codon:yes gene_type:complete